jgi:hypothetical protein
MLASVISGHALLAMLLALAGGIAATALARGRRN